MYKLSFKLKQHTPIILFHDHEGAMLRSTEVKAKLDKFLNVRFGNSLSQFAKRASGRITASYDFALSFRPSRPVGVFKRTLVGEKEDKERPQRLCLFKEISGTIQAKHPELISILQGQLKDFFILHNFGKRTSKGYGSFSVANINGKEVFSSKEDCIKVINDYYYYLGSYTINLNDLEFYTISSTQLFEITSNDQDVIRKFKRKRAFNFEIPEEYVNEGNIQNYYYENSVVNHLKEIFRSAVSIKLINLKKEFSSHEVEVNQSILENIINNHLPYNYFHDLFNTIDSSNRILKSGQNPGGKEHYIKSKLFLYFIEKGVRWEKRRIKIAINKLSEVQRRRQRLQFENPPSINRYIGDNTWSDDRNDEQNYFFIRALLGLPELYEFKTTDRHTKFIVKFKGDAAERFQSPLIFKVIDGHIFYCLDKRFDIIAGQQFKVMFSVKTKQEPSTSSEEELFTICTPAFDDNSKRAFIEFLKNYFTHERK
ncbi:MAG: hypothetical protein U0T84_07965 [Chitinophagales bacterium]